jgi:hypothetical protein
MATNVQAFISGRAKALGLDLTALGNKLLRVARRAGAGRGRSVFKELAVLEDGTRLVAALDHRLQDDPHEWVLWVDPDGLGVPFDRLHGPPPSEN